MKDKKVLLLGGTGAMGVYLVPELLKQGHEVYVTSRSERKSNDPNLHYILGDAHDSAFLDKHLSNHWDAIVDFMIYSTNEFKHRVQLLLNSTDHYLFLSTYRVFAESSIPITEDSPRLLDVCKDKDYLLTDEYALSKARQENILREASKKNWTIVRPSITYSKERFQLGTLEADAILFRSMQGLPVALASEILNKETTMTWGGDVAKMIARLIFNSKTYGEDFNVVTNEHHTWKRVAQVYADYANLKLVEIDLDSYLKMVSNPYQVRFDRMYNRIMDNSKVIEVTQINPEGLTKLKDGLGKEIIDFVDNPPEIFIDYRLQARMDRITGSKISLENASTIEQLKYYYNCLKFILNK